MQWHVQWIHIRWRVEMVVGLYVWGVGAVSFDWHLWGATVSPVKSFGCTSIKIVFWNLPEKYLITFYFLMVRHASNASTMHKEERFLHRTKMTCMHNASQFSGIPQISQVHSLVQIKFPMRLLLFYSLRPKQYTFHSRIPRWFCFNDTQSCEFLFRKTWRRQIIFTCHLLLVYVIVIQDLRQHIVQEWACA